VRFPQGKITPSIEPRNSEYGRNVSLELFRLVFFHQQLAVKITIQPPTPPNRKEKNRDFHFISNHFAHLFPHTL
jgi:hypothetical protein